MLLDINSRYWQACVWRFKVASSNEILNVPLNQTDYHTDVNTIKYNAQENGYDHQLIESLIKKMQNEENCKPIRKKLTQTKKNHNINTSQPIHTKIA